MLTLRTVARRAAFPKVWFCSLSSTCASILSRTPSSLWGRGCSEQGSRCHTRDQEKGTSVEQVQPTPCPPPQPPGLQPSPALTAEAIAVPWHLRPAPVRGVCPGQRAGPLRPAPRRA